MRAHLLEKEGGHKVRSLFHQLPSCPGFLIRLGCLREGASPPSDQGLWASLRSVCTRRAGTSTPLGLFPSLEGEVEGWGNRIGRVAATSSFLSIKLCRSLWRVLALPSPSYLSCHCHPPGKCSGWSPAPPSAHCQRRPRCSGARGVRGRAW